MYYNSTKQVLVDNSEVSAPARMRVVAPWKGKPFAIYLERAGI